MPSAASPARPRMRHQHGRWPSLLLALSLVACARVDAPQTSLARSGEAERLCLDTLSIPAAPPVTQPDADDAALAAALAAARQTPPQAATRIALGRTWLRLAQARSRAGWLLQAGACAAAARVLAADAIPVLELDAAVALAQHRFRDAERLALRALAARPDALAALGVLSDARLELGDYAGAATATRQQMQLWPGAAAHARSAWLHWLHGDVRAARQAMLQALRGRDARTPGFNAWLWSETALLYWQEGDLEGAAQLYEQALAQRRGFAPALLGQARIALARERPQLATRLARAADAAGAGMDAAIVLGDALHALGETDAAAAAWRRAEALGRRSDDLGLARFLVERDRQPELGRRMLERLHRERPSIQVEAALAWAHYRTGDCIAALNHSRAARRLGTRESQLWRQSAEIESHCGNATTARTLAAAARHLAPATAPRT